MSPPSDADDVTVTEINDCVVVVDCGNKHTGRVLSQPAFAARRTPHRDVLDPGVPVTTN